MSCTRFEPGGGCPAFPDGIPDEILFGGFDHRHEYPGDQGIRYEQRPDELSARLLVEYEETYT